MKIFLASYKEIENHGPGKKFAIASTKPDNISVEGFYKYLTPAEETIEKYREIQTDDQVVAGEFFNNTFKQQLNSFCREVEEVSKEENVSIFELLPFKDGDTLLSWERNGYTNYRSLVADCLVKLGYDVVSK